MQRLRNSCTTLILYSAPLATLVGCSAEPVLIPTSYATYTSKDETFACEYPEGWQAKGGGKNPGPVWAKFSSGPALIHMKTSVTGSLMSDAMGGAAVDTDSLGPQFEPVHRIHMVGMEEAEILFDGYVETPTSPMVIQCQLGPARCSEFTAETTFGSQVHGYRATYIGHNKGVTVYCTCLESDWQAVKPVFDKVLVSLQRG